MKYQRGESMMFVFVYCIVTTEMMTLVTKPMIATEKMWPIYIQATAIFLLRSSFTMISLSFVVKPEPVNNEATWNLILLVAKPVNLKATKKASILNMYREITANINATANNIFITTSWNPSCYYILYNFHS